MRISLSEVRNPHMKNNVVAMLIARTLVLSRSGAEVTVLVFGTEYAARIKVLSRSTSMIGNVLENNPRPHSQKRRCIFLDAVGGVYRNFEIGAQFHALRQSDAVKRFEQAFVVPSAMAWICDGERRAKHIA